ncbi:hypothetical protein TIFTF001_055107 [Ficus carica]|nr:hypothetical protein TIFTF001_055106 [Ficus carica]GMN70952.1 hypothetical protein TIFTF001_055107 [Ficus carica]
MFGESS